MMNEPAFPHLLSQCQRQGETEMYPGLTKREWMAGMIACGYVANKARPEHFLPENDATWILRLTDLILEKAKS